MCQFFTKIALYSEINFLRIFSERNSDLYSLLSTSIMKSGIWLKTEALILYFIFQKKLNSQGACNDNFKRKLVADLICLASVKINGNKIFLSVDNAL